MKKLFSGVLNLNISLKGITNHKTYFLFSSFFFLLSFLHSQILTNYPQNLDENIFSNTVFFSEKFIRQNKIKSATAEISFKRDLQPIVKTGNFQIFEFNEGGKLIKQSETISIAGNIKDTSVSYLVYNEKNQLELKRSSDGYGFYSYYYEYDHAGNIIKQVYSRDEPLPGRAKNDFQLGRQFIINSETFQYEQLSPKQKKRRFFNDLGMEYKSAITYYNEYENISEEESRFIVSGKKSAITYKYDDFFRLSEKTDFSSVSGENKIVSVFTYDEFGNVMQEKISRNGTLKTTREFVYDKKTFLLDAQLIKDEATQTIHIYKYGYEFSPP